MSDLEQKILTGVASLLLGAIVTAIGYIYKRRAEKKDKRDDPDMIIKRLRDEVDALQALSKEQAVIIKEERTERQKANDEKEICLNQKHAVEMDCLKKNNEIELLKLKSK